MSADSFFDDDTGDPGQLLIEITTDDGTPAQRISVTGEIDVLNASAVHDAVVDLLRQGSPRRIEIDLGGVTFLDSAGIRTLLTCHAAAERTDCPFAVVNPHPRVYRVLQITGLLDHFELTPGRPGTPPSPTSVRPPAEY